MNKEHWQFRYWDYWSKLIHQETLNHSHFFDDGRIHHQEMFCGLTDNNYVDEEWQPTNDKDQRFVKLVKGNEYYLLPERFIQDMPLNATAYIDVKLKRSDTKVWRFISSVKSMNIPIPEQPSRSYSEHLDSWNCVEHSNPKTWKLLKMIADCKDLKLAVCGGVGCGKNSNLILKSKLRNNVAPKVKQTTKAKFYKTIYHCQYVNIDEITSWTPSIVRESIEDITGDMADESPDLSKHATDTNRNMENISTIGKTLTFTFNPVSKDNKKTFASRFSNFDKINDRYPILLLEGKVLDTLPVPNNGQIERVVKQNMQEMIRVAIDDMYWHEKIHRHLHDYDRGLIERFFKDRKLGRHLGNITPLIDRCDVVSDTQEEFNDWMSFIIESICAYKQHVLEHDVFSNVDLVGEDTITENQTKIK